MKFFCILLAVLMFSPGNTVFIKRKSFEGYIFPADHPALVSMKEDVSKHNLGQLYTPTEADIEKAEALLKDQIKSLNSALTNQGRGCPVIHRRLKRYRRQYVGLVNNNGEKVIWVNMYWWNPRESETNLDKEIAFVFDGCSYYWNVKVNINTGLVDDLVINGVA